MNAYVDTLAEWYENAERISRANMPNDGDTIMYPSADGAYTIEPATFGWVASITFPDDPVRILHRAPNPKPAWHDAVAVTADVGRIDGARRVLAKDENGIWNDSLNGHGYEAGRLRDVTPLIEQEVTGEMVQRIREASRDGRIKGSYRDVDGYYRDILTAALNLDPA